MRFWQDRSGRTTCSSIVNTSNFLLGSPSLGYHFFALSSRPISFTFSLPFSVFPFPAPLLPPSSLYFTLPSISPPALVPLWMCSSSLRVPSVRLAASLVPPIPVSPRLPTSFSSARSIPCGPARRVSSTPCPPRPLARRSAVVG